jgi:ribosomal protein L30E
MKAEIRKLLGTDKLVIGTDRVMKLLRAGDLKQVLVASNCKADVRDDVTHLAGDAEVVALDVTNEELGVFCKKAFNIQVLGIKA